MSAELLALSNALAQETERAAASAVAVHTEAHGSSSGVIWRTGVIVTAEHALRRDEDVKVKLADGRTVAATLAGRDPSTDLAVLRCPEATTAVAQFGEASAVKPGALVLVVGQTRASGPIAALGAVSLVAAQRRTWTDGAVAPYIRIDVGLQPTTVGAAVVDASGHVIGIATPRFARFGAIAVPTATVNRVVDTLLEKGRIPRGFLGVGLQTIQLPEALRQLLQRDQKTAAIVLEVQPDGPAQKAGFVIGDILASIADRPVARVEDVHTQLADGAIGETLAVKFFRGGVLREASMVVGERPHGGD